jgi:predicted nuclease with TOPRIM domain
MQGPPSKANAKGHSGGRDVEDLQNELFNIRREIKQFAEENKVLKTKLARAAHEIQSRDARIEVLDTERWQLLEMQSRSERMIQAITLELAAAQTRKRAAKPKQPARV